MAEIYQFEVFKALEGKLGDMFGDRYVRVFAKKIQNDNLSFLDNLDNFGLNFIESCII